MVILILTAVVETSVEESMMMVMMAGLAVMLRCNCLSVEGNFGRLCMFLGRLCSFSFLIVCRQLSIGNQYFLLFELYTKQ